MADEPVRTITVNGTGSADITPDRATLRASIVALDATVEAAQKTAVSVTNRVLKVTDSLGIKREKVDTTGASIRADYRWNPKEEEQQLRGYIAEREIIIQIDDLEKLGAVVEGAVSAGVNQVSPPQLESSKRKEAYRQALRAAAEDAKANASVLAVSLGAQLGKVISINADPNTPRPPMPYAANRSVMAADSGGAESYNAADLSFDASVTAVFELVD